MTSTRPHVEQVRRIVATRLPHAPLESVRPLGRGLDHHAYLVDDDLVVRVSDRGQDGMHREARLLRAVSQISPVPVPEPLFAGATYMGYKLVPGVPLIDLPARDRAEPAVAVARTLGDVLAALWGVAPEHAARLADADDTSLEDWRDEAAELVEQLGEALPRDARRPIDDFLRAPAPQAAPTRALSHNDLGIEHVLVDPDTTRVTGIIDWSDAAIVDPAKDLGLILRDLGPAALDAALRRTAPKLGGDVAGARDRAGFYARCLALEDLAYGLESGQRRYLDKSRDALRELFAG